jgi:hypothetical protein
MLRRPKHSKIEVVAPKEEKGEEKEDSGRKVNILGSDNVCCCEKNSSYERVSNSEWSPRQRCHHLLFVRGLTANDDDAKFRDYTQYIKRIRNLDVN